MTQWPSNVVYPRRLVSESRAPVNAALFAQGSHVHITKISLRCPSTKKILRSEGKTRPRIRGVIRFQWKKVDTCRKFSDTPSYANNNKDTLRGLEWLASACLGAGGGNLSMYSLSHPSIVRRAMMLPCATHIHSCVSYQIRLVRYLQPRLAAICRVLINE
jgi:hypothetical protein